MRLNQRVTRWFISAMSDRLLFVGYRLIRRSRYLYLKIGITLKEIGGRGE